MDPGAAARDFHQATKHSRRRVVGAGMLPLGTARRPPQFKGYAGGELIGPAALLLTSAFWRNAWKYGPRAYRHTFWDGGVLLANVLAAAQALGLPARLVLGFEDDRIARLLDLDPEREAPFALVALGSGGPP